MNDEVDVLCVGVSGSGKVRINGGLHCLSGGTLLLVPKGARRSIRGISGDFAYLTVHRRRGPLKIGVPRRDAECRAGQEVGRVEPEGAHADLPTPEPPAPSEIQAVPEKGHQEERQRYAEGVDGQQRGPAHRPSGGRRDGEDSAQDRTGAEAREAVDGAQGQTRGRRTTADLAPQAFEGTEGEAAAEGLQDTGGDQDRTRDGDEGAPVPIEEGADRGDAPRTARASPRARGRRAPSSSQAPLLLRRRRRRRRAGAERCTG